MVFVFQRVVEQVVEDEEEEDDLADIDDEEINSYILSESEAKNKANVWKMLNQEYLTLQVEKKAREEIEGKKEKKKRKPKSSKCTSVAKTAGEAIEKMLKEKKISTKINYDVLKNLDFTVDVETGAMIPEQKSAPKIIENLEIRSNITRAPKTKSVKEKRETPKTVNKPVTVDSVKAIPKTEVKEEIIKQEEESNQRLDEYDDDYDLEEEKEEEEETLSSMFRRNVDDEEYDDY